MPARQTTEDIIHKAKLVHGDRYDYSKTEYVGRHKKIKIICRIHGEYEQGVGNHLQGQNCPKCVLEAASKRLQYTSGIFIEKSRIIYGDKFSYDKTEYKTSKTPVTVICSIHGDVSVQPDRFLMGAGCPKCNGVFVRDGISFMEASIEKYGDIYNYSLVKYVDAKTKVQIICPTHGVFTTTPDAFLHKWKYGCPSCGKEIEIAQYYSAFLATANKIHGSKYDYSCVKYVGSNKKVEIICPTHGMFLQTPTKHMEGRGCPKCRSSSGETEVRVFLEKHQMVYAQEYSIPECRDKGMLHFDFALFSSESPEKLVALIEYDGEHHYKAISMWGDSVYLEDIQRRDAIKNQFCEDNNIPLLRIPYWDKDKIPEKLETFLKEIQA